MDVVTVRYAKTHLSKLLAAVERGEEIAIVRGGRPVARLVAAEPTEERELGFVPYDVPDSFFEPLAEDELGAWNQGVLPAQDRVANDHEGVADGQLVR